MSKDLVKSKLELLTLKRSLERKLVTCFSPDNLDSVPTFEQQRFLNDINKYRMRWAVSSNKSGKTSAALRECAWLFTNTHPFFKRPKEWGNEPLLMVILGAKSDQMEIGTWEKRLKPLLPDGCYDVKRKGGSLNKVINTENGNMIIFQSHHDPEKARENLQNYSIHWSLIDEMPKSQRLISEIMRGVTTINGRFVAAFTPLIVNKAIKKLVTSARPPTAEVYKFLLKDNPANLERLDEILADIRAVCVSDAEYRCRVDGEWIAAGKSVSCYDPEMHSVEGFPVGYGTGWRHVVSVDPASSGMLGLTVWGEDPKNGVWYCVKAKEIQGKADFILVQEVEKEVQGLNIVRRVCDTNPAGFQKEAARVGIFYRPIQQKRERKSELISNSNKKLITNKMKIISGVCEILEDDLVTAAWSETVPDKIINSSSYHCFDTMQYAADVLPEWTEEIKVVMTPAEALFHQFQEEKKEKLTKKPESKRKQIMYKIIKRRGRYWDGV